MPEIEVAPVEIDLETDEPRGIKRGARPVDKKAEAMSKKLQLPKVPARTITDEQWSDYAKLLTPDMWTQVCTMYLYRLKPKIIREQSNPTNKRYIDKMSEIIDLRSYIKRNHSWGKYRCEINQLVPNGSGEKKLVDVICDISEDESPGLLLNVDELDKNAPENMGLLNRLNAMGSLGNKHNNPQESNSITGQDMMAMFDKMLTTVTRMNQEQKEDLRARLQQQGNEAGGLGGAIGTLLLERMKQDNPNNVLQSIAAFKDMFKSPDNPMVGIMPIFLQFVTMMQEQNKVALEQARSHSEQMVTLLKDVKAGSNKPDNMLQSVEAAIGIAERLKDLGGGGSRSTGEVILEYVKEIGLPILQYGTRIFEVAKMGQAAGKPVVTKPGATATTPRQLTASELVAQRVKEARANGKEGEKVEDKPIDATEITEPSEEDMMLTQAMSQAGRFFVKFLNEDKTGADLALALIDLEGKAAYSRFAAFGEEKLVAAAKSIPELWEALSPFGESNIKQFAEEFCHYEEYLEPEEEEVPKPEKKERRGRVKE